MASRGADIPGESRIMPLETGPSNDSPVDDAVFFRRKCPLRLPMKTSPASLFALLFSLRHVFPSIGTAFFLPPARFHFFNFHYLTVTAAFGTAFRRVKAMVGAALLLRHREFKIPVALNALKDLDVHWVSLMAMGVTATAFDGRSIQGRRIARRSNTPGMLTSHALQPRRLDHCGASPHSDPGSFRGRWVFRLVPPLKAMGMPWSTRERTGIGPVRFAP